MGPPRLPANTPCVPAKVGPLVFGVANVERLPPLHPTIISEQSITTPAIFVLITCPLLYNALSPSRVRCRAETVTTDTWMLRAMSVPQPFSTELPLFL